MQTNTENCKILEIDNTLIANEIQSRVGRTENKFVQSVHQAYQYHHPLALSPDIVWLAIMQGFAIHVTENAEKLRKQIVDFEGKKNLGIVMEEADLDKINIYQAVDKFAGKIEENIGERLYKTCIPKFSTSNNVTLVAFQMTLMGAMEKYFEYNMVCGCGIPRVKLLGTLEDWILLRNQATNLREFDLKWWIDKLVIVLDKLIAAYKGEIDKNFWNDIYQYRAGGGSGLGPERASGWITYFFPYEQFSEKGFSRAQLENQVCTQSIPNGICKVPVKYFNLETNESKTINFESGFFSVQKDKDGFLSPKIGWSVVNQDDMELSNPFRIGRR